MKNSEALRGSVKLLRDGWADGIQPQSVDDLIAVLDRDGVRVKDIFCKGIPVPEVLTGAATIDRQQLGELATAILEIPELRLRRLDCFPNGIPFPELLDIHFELGR